MSGNGVAADDAPKTTVIRDGGAAALAAAALENAAAGASQAQDPARSRRRDLAARARQEAQSGQYSGGAPGSDPEAEAPADDAPGVTREPIESLTLELPNGMRIEFGPPPGVSLAVRMMMFFGGRDPSAGEDRITSTMMCVREINGKPVKIGNPVERDKYINLIGDDGLALLQYTHRTYWPPPTIADLKIVKKTSKTP